MANLFAQYLQQPKSALDYSQEYGAAQAASQQNALQNALTGIKLQQLGQEREQSNALNALYANPNFQSGDTASRVKMLQGLGPAGFKQGQEMEQADLQRRQAEGALKTQGIQQENMAHELRQKKFASVIPEIVSASSPEQIAAVASRHLSDGDITQEQHDNIISQAQAAANDPSKFSEFKRNLVVGVMSAKDIADQQFREKQLSLQERQVAVQERKEPSPMVWDATNRVFTNNQGAWFDPATGKSGGPAGSMGGPAPVPASSGGAEPRGIRNNNPANLRFAGQTGATKDADGFAVFPTMEAGRAALDNQLSLYRSKYGLDTIQGVINRYAPSNENNTGAYVQFVAQRMGIAPGQRIDLSDPALRQKLGDAIVEYENGSGSTSNVAAARPAQAAGTGFPSKPIKWKINEKAGTRENPETGEVEPLRGPDGKPVPAYVAAQNAPQEQAQGIADTIGQVQALLKHPGLSPAVGAGGWGTLGLPFADRIPGTDAANFKARLDQLKGGAFLQAYQSLRGGGAITEVEGKKAQDAIARMDSSQSEDEFRRAMTDYMGVLDRGYQKLTGKSLLSAGKAQTTARSAAPAVGSSAPSVSGWSTPQAPVARPLQDW